MELKHFKLIHAIHEEGSLSRAAEKLYLTQSALSHQLKEIETEIGTLAFKRSNKRLLITDAGQILLQSAQRILPEVEHARLEIKRQLKNDLGKLTICTECYTCYHWLPPILKRFNSLFPNVDMNINTDNIRKPLELVHAGRLDIAIVHRQPADKMLVYKELFSDELVALLPNGHPLTKENYLVAEHFRDLHIITHVLKFEQSTLHEKLLAPAGVKPAKLTYVQLTEAAIEMVKFGLGVSVMAKWAIKPYLDGGKFQIRRLTKKGLHRKWAAAYLSTNSQLKYILRFNELLLEHWNL